MDTIMSGRELKAEVLTLDPPRPTPEQLLLEHMTMYPCECITWTQLQGHDLYLHLDPTPECTWTDRDQEMLEVEPGATYRLKEVIPTMQPLKLRIPLNLSVAMREGDLRVHLHANNTANARTE